MNKIIFLAAFTLLFIAACGSSPEEEDRATCKPLRGYEWENDNYIFIIEGDFNVPEQHYEGDCAYYELITGNENEGNLERGANGASNAHECSYLNVLYTYTKTCNTLILCEGNNCQDFK